MAEEQVVVSMVVVVEAEEAAPSVERMVVDGEVGRVFGHEDEAWAEDVALVWVEVWVGDQSQSARTVGKDFLEGRSRSRGVFVPVLCAWLALYSCRRYEMRTSTA